MTLRSLLVLIGLAPALDFPDQRKVNHMFKNHRAAMQGAERLAKRISDKQDHDPRRAELRALKEQSVSTIDAIVREMQGRK